VLYIYIYYIFSLYTINYKYTTTIHYISNHLPTPLNLLLQILCLPTDYHNYHTHLPLWVSIWSTLQHNIYWDCCWLTLFARSRKYLFDSNSNTVYGTVATHLTPVLFNKLREILKIPLISVTDMKASSGNPTKGLAKNDYPTLLPSYYTKLLPLKTDVYKVSINKIGKCIYYCINSNMLGYPTPSTPSTITLTPTMARFKSSTIRFELSTSVQDCT